MDAKDRKREVNMAIIPQRFARSTLATILVSIGVVISITSCQAVIGDSGFGDPYHPELGNGGYNVDHYDIVLRIDPPSNFIDADVTIEATATERLRSFNLDFGALRVVSLEVDGAPASFSQEGNEISVTPGRPLSTGRPFTVSIEYEGRPEPIDSFVLHSPVGWFHSEDGTINVFSWPDGAGSWLPGNHHPSDKATFRFKISVPDPWVVVAPGSERDFQEQNGEKHYVFEMTEPMSSVSAVLYVDDYDVSVFQGPAGVQITTYVPPDAPKAVSDNFHELPAMMEYFEGLFGKYPFKQYTIVIADPAVALCEGIASANADQTISAHCPSSLSTSRSILAHEMTHQWFGISATPAMYKDSWLAEGPATYAGWMWQNRGESAEEMDRVVKKQRSYYEGIPRASVPIGVPPDYIISDAIYTGAGILLHSLRREVGDEAFFSILREYLSRYQYSNATTADFIDVAEEISGRDLNHFFDNWLYENELPPVPGTG